MYLNWILTRRIPTRDSMYGRPNYINFYSVPGAAEMSNFGWSVSVKIFGHKGVPLFTPLMFGTIDLRLWAPRCKCKEIDSPRLSIMVPMELRVKMVWYTPALFVKVTLCICLWKGDSVLWGTVNGLTPSSTGPVINLAPHKGLIMHCARNRHQN